MNTSMLLPLSTFLLAVTIVSAEVMVKEYVDPIDGTQRVSLGVQGDTAYPGAERQKPTLSVICVKTMRKHRVRIETPGVSLSTETEPIDIRNMFGLTEDAVRTQVRFEQDASARYVTWERTSHGGLMAGGGDLASIIAFKDDTKFLKRILQERIVHIRILTYDGTDGGTLGTSSFDLTGLAEAFAQQDTCKVPK